MKPSIVDNKRGKTMIIDARKDGHEEYRPNSTNGALWSHLSKLDIGEHIMVDEVISKKGVTLTADQVRGHIKSLGNLQEKRFKVQGLRGIFKITLLRNGVKKKEEPKDKIKLVDVDVMEDTHESFNTGTIRGAIAHHVLSLKRGESVKFFDVYNARNEFVSIISVVRHIYHISMFSGAEFMKYRCKKDGLLIVLMMKEPTKTRKLIKVYRKVEHRKPREEKQEIIQPRASAINSFLTGGFDNVNAKRETA
jgi:hypothetical protein